MAHYVPKHAGDEACNELEQACCRAVPANRACAQPIRNEVRGECEHVYSDPHWPSGDRLSAKLAVTRATRHASVRFVTGYLDWVGSRMEFLDLVRKSDKPILVVFGDETPTRSRAEMEALAEMPNVRIERLAKGKLSIHE